MRLLTLAVPFLMAAVIGALATRLWIAIAERGGWVAAPNPIVPQHRRPTAHMGGVAVAAATYTVLALIAGGLLPLGGGGEPWNAGVPEDSFGDAEIPGNLRLALIAGGLGFLCLGVLDDRVRLAPLTKLLLQIACAGAAATLGLVFPFVGMSVLDVLLTIALLVTAVNAVNLTDVCDGLVAGLAAIAFVSLTLAHPETRAWSAAAAGACVGFLVFNAPPARVFLGDAGSHWLGFMLMALPLSASTRTPHAPHAQAWHVTEIALTMGVFLFELLLLIVARRRKGIPFWRGSPDHFALRLQRAGLSRWSTVGIAWLTGLAFGLLPWTLRPLSSAARVWGVMLIGASALAGFIALLRLDAPRTSVPGRVPLQDSGMRSRPARRRR